MQKITIKSIQYTENKTTVEFQNNDEEFKELHYIIGVPIKKDIEQISQNTFKIELEGNRTLQDIIYLVNAVEYWFKEVKKESEFHSIPYEGMIQRLEYLMERKILKKVIIKGRVLHTECTNQLWCLNHILDSVETAELVKQQIRNGIFPI